MQERSGGELGNSDPYSEFYTVVLANDYTKNISEPIHSSGLIDDDGAGPRKLQQYAQSRRGSNMPQKVNSKMMKYSDKSAANVIQSPQKQSAKKQKELLKNEADKLI